MVENQKNKTRVMYNPVGFLRVNEYFITASDFHHLHLI